MLVFLSLAFLLVFVSFLSPRIPRKHPEAYNSTGEQPHHLIGPTGWDRADQFPRLGLFAFLSFSILVLAVRLPPSHVHLLLFGERRQCDSVAVLDVFSAAPKLFADPPQLPHTTRP
ncbi:hypothetical protein BD289DRAFT_440493 [Coniella lustricola]|uniref:Uncharacterized protein n=1 Tax=Coniella lustricola TaxID=2025994 RepID=A0A2T3A0M8_9PEZI|nr:hypothetical protein BD289DRAFT_440493 [Coniella lustricola]